ncbi:sialate O-acetylesterase [Hymenobacter aerilatus]|uniref:Sialate O-acetylesterase n=1 Tax=Hymenobacter aerilatus TaxID=2932251 RepID=A0A8T9SV39_9BACT|nr:sialate O-acetylesterase [Hymenobacter aerilatus]UOR05958.1 sialate O-acetylesterase [Hymenobacter aerilatus]
MRCVLPLLAATLAATTTHAAVRLPKLVGDHMVLQRDKPLPIWGWADAGEAVTVMFKGKTYKATPTGDAGKWMVQLPATPAGGPYALVVKGQNTITVHDVLMGDVWLASGQSNMEWPLREANNGAQEVAAANFPNIRLLDVPNAVASTPKTDFGGTGWHPCTPETVAGFSAVAYFFGRDLQKQYNVPIGLISSEWGGTPAEAWTSTEALGTLPDFKGKVAASTGDIEQRQQAYAAQLAQWQRTPAAHDQGRAAGHAPWSAAGVATPDWPTMPLPGPWEQHANLAALDGVVWFRKEVDLTAAEAGKPLTLHLSVIDDADSTWFNGTFVGTTNGYATPRAYTVPAALVKPGRNTIAVRVLDLGQGGGIWGKPEDLHLTTATRTLPLSGDWRYHIGVDNRLAPPNPFPGGAQNEPTLLFNAMIAPLIPYAIKGVIWYQGESNASRAAQYQKLFPTMIRDWRGRWQEGDFPFLFVQLANFQPDQDQPADYEWAELREAQRQTLSLPNTGMAVAIDIGNTNDIHPRNKQEVGRRLALAARRVAYNDKNVVYSGPTFEKMEPRGTTVRLTFSNLGGGLVLKDASGPYLKGFAVAGADRKFHWAQGRLEGNTLVLSSKEVSQPQAVRYDWSNSPTPNLYNKAGLPASPFQANRK